LGGFTLSVSEILMVFKVPLVTILCSVVGVYFSMRTSHLRTFNEIAGAIIRKLI
jgi:hypothetical protein